MEVAEKTYRWGILGTGHIAEKLVKSSWSVAGCQVFACASRSSGRAGDFAEKFEIEKTYDNYEELVQDPEIDIVYVANTHNAHHESALMALSAGKHVLCEKPLAMNAGQAREMVESARKRNLFLMEGMWTRFLPAIVQVRNWLNDKSIGKVKQIHASFGLDLLHVKRLTDPALAGGALLDLGIYPLSFASMIMSGKRASFVESRVEMLDTGVDGASALMMEYDDGCWADLKCSCMYRLPNEAWIIGDKGHIHIPADFYGAQRVKLITDGKETEQSFPSEKQQSFKYEIAEVQSCIESGLTESAVMPLDETIALAETTDELRYRWGVKYPGE